MKNNYEEDFPIQVKSGETRFWTIVGVISFFVFCSLLYEIGKFIDNYFILNIIKFFTK